MSMPTIPENKYRPSFNETIIDLLESIALEETALSHILNAQGEKLQHAVRKSKCEKISLCELEESFALANKTLVEVIMKEWLLIVKMNNISDIIRKRKKKKRKTENNT
ncbi:MAG: hypothetical protein ACK5HL_01090 [Bacilli bacterium]